MKLGMNAEIIVIRAAVGLFDKLRAGSERRLHVNGKFFTES
jgi:hypothetical protein